MAATTADPRAAQPDHTEALARVGLAARGVVFTTFGLIAVRLAFLGSTAGEEASTSGAFAEIVEKPLGTVLVAVTALGLAAWALSCAVAVVTGRNGSKPGRSEPLDRARDAVRGAIAVALCATAVRVLTQGEQAASGSGEQQRTWTARLMDAPAGRGVVGLIGLAVLGAGLYHVVKAFKRDFLEHVDLGRLGSAALRTPAEWLGLAGHVGRGLSFAIVGGFVLRAAVEHDPDQSKGIDAALRDLAGGGPGRLLLVVTAVGLVCFGLWAFVEARCRRSDV